MGVLGAQLGLIPGWGIRSVSVRPEQAYRTRSEWIGANQIGRTDHAATSLKRREVDVKVVVSPKNRDC